MFKFTRDLIQGGKQMSNSDLGFVWTKVIKRHSEDNWKSLNKDWLLDIKC